MEDEILGTLTWEDRIGWCGTIPLANGKTATLTIDAAKTDQAIPEVIRKAATRVIANEPQIRAKIAADMSKIYNETWSGGDTITPEEMARRITLVDLSVYEEGDGALSYEADDDLFTDHTICAYMDVYGEIDEPGLEG
ncbi:MAG TPA: DUF2262 domain-containing protein [Blastocatellia bacterium]|nr:DUF2262 domain-containing protein [Blastocatellia bacterium]